VKKTVDIVQGHDDLFPFKFLNMPCIMDKVDRNGIKKYQVILMVVDMPEDRPYKIPVRFTLLYHPGIPVKFSVEQVAQLMHGFFISENGDGIYVGIKKRDQCIRDLKMSFFNYGDFH